MTDTEPVGPQKSLLDTIDVTNPDWHRHLSDDDWYQLGKKCRELQKNLDALSSEYNELDQKILGRLHITPTNNTYMLFIKKEPITTNIDEQDLASRSMYNFHASAHDNKPGAIKLRELHQTYPELFAEMAELIEAKDRVDAPIYAAMKSGQWSPVSEEDYINSEAMRLKVRAYMEVILNMLREMGVNEEAIGDLGV